jgi:putative hydrolase of the HAD superfamily
MPTNPGAPPAAILFDLDDTILDFTAPAEPAWRQATEAFAADYGGCSAADVQAAIGRVSQEWWSDPQRHRDGRLALQATRRQNVADALARLGIADDGPAGQRLSSRLADTFGRLRTEGLRLFPGAIETLEHCREAGVPLALVTNGDSAGQRAKIERFDLAGWFDCIVVEEEFGVGKPDERVFHHALAELGAPAAASWMVGDNLRWEIEPCRRLGLHTVWVDVRGQGLPSGCDIEPHRTVRSIRELLPL